MKKVIAVLLGLAGLVSSAFVVLCFVLMQDQHQIGNLHLLFMFGMFYLFSLLAGAGLVQTFKGVVR